MILTLRAVSLNDQPLTRPITARFDAAGGTIGRADHSTLALPDPERFISRKQADVVFTRDGFLLRNVGGANPITLGNRTLASGDAAVLADGDAVLIGGYLLRAECHPDAAADSAAAKRLVRAAQAASPAATPAATPLLPATAPTPRPATPAASSNPFADLLAGDGGAPGPADPFADLLNPVAAAAPPPLPRSGGNAFDGLMPPAAGLHRGSPAVAAAAVPAAPRRPDDFAPFASPAGPAGIAPGLPAQPPADPLAAFAPAQPSLGIEHQFGLAGSRGRDPLADFEFDLSAPANAGADADAGGRLAATDPLSMFDTAMPPTAAAAGIASLPMQDDLPGVHAAFAPPVLAAAAAAATDPAPRAATLSAAPTAQPAPAAATDAQLWQAFCGGAGVQLPPPADSAQAAARMQQIGKVLRAAVAGTRELMKVRADTKYEMRAAITQIQSLGNNPLKFAPDVASGVEQLVLPAARGFLEGPAAMDDAMRDLAGHSIGSVAGMRAALEGLFDRFDPTTLEQTLGAGSLLDTLMPLNRKARLWELYLQRFRALRDEAQDDFHTLFGKAFVAAYEQQVAGFKKSDGAEAP